MLSKEQIENLKELAGKATPGPWYVQYGDDSADMCMTAISPQNRRQNNIGDFPTDQPLIALTYHQQKPWVLDDEPERADTNSEYIAAANPAVVIELITMLREAQKDAARYRWLLANSFMGIGQWGKDWDLQLTDQPLPAPDHIGEVSDWIDAAMQRDCVGVRRD